MSKYRTTNLRFPEATYRELQMQAERRGSTLAAVVREAVADYLGRSGAAVTLPFGGDPVDELVGTIEGGPTDESVNHDHYLYDTPPETPAAPSAHDAPAPHAHDAPGANPHSKEARREAAGGHQRPARPVPAQRSTPRRRR